MDDWIRYSQAAIAEAWQELIRDILDGKAVSLEIYAVANEPVKIKRCVSYKDRNWPGGNSQCSHPALIE